MAWGTRSSIQALAQANTSVPFGLRPGGPFSISQHLLRSVIGATLVLLVERYTKELYISHGKYRSRLNEAVAAVCEINPGRGGIAPRDSYHEAGKHHEQANEARRLMTRYHVGRTDSQLFNFTR